MTTNITDTPRLYIADLAAYNAGHLHGVWIDATDDLDDIWDQINTMLEASPTQDAEEYAIHDYEGFGGYRVEEYDSIDELHEIACFIEEHPVFGAELLNHCSDLKEAQKMAEESYNGCYTSLADYAQELTEQTGDIPSHLEYYIDYDRMSRDMKLSGDIFSIETAHDEVHVFWGC